MELREQALRRGLFDVGVSIGEASHAAEAGNRRERIVKSLGLAKQAAVKSQCVSVEGIDDVIEVARKAPRIDQVRESIADFRKLLQARISGRQPELSCDINCWLGTWQTNWGEMTLVLTEDELIKGYYGGGQSKWVSGEFNPENPCVLNGVWKYSNGTTGRIQFRLTGPHRFVGTWTSGKEDPAGKGVNWSGTRRNPHDARQPSKEQDPHESEGEAVPGSDG